LHLNLYAFLQIAVWAMKGESTPFDGVSINVFLKRVPKYKKTRISPSLDVGSISYQKYGKVYLTCIMFDEVN